jgi:hypothetical protein
MTSDADPDPVFKFSGSVADPDLGSSAVLNPGSETRMKQNPDPRSVIKISDPDPAFLVNARIQIQGFDDQNLKKNV